MTNIQTVKRKILLKNQAIKLMCAERSELKRQLMLLRWKDALDKKIKSSFDQDTSQKLDCILFLLGE